MTIQPIHVSDQQLNSLFQVDGDGLLFVSPVIVDWKPLAERRVRLVIDLEGQVDCGVPTIPNNLIYVYFPFDDSGLPDLVKLHALGRLAAEMIRNQRAVLIHCAMGLNRSPLMAGVAMTYLGRSGAEALALLQSQRVGVLFNGVYANYLKSLPRSDEFKREPELSQ
jgi:protein-tyrosine phosphatase